MGEITMLEATEGLNFCPGANRFSWKGFSSVDEGATKKDLEAVLEQLRTNKNDYELEWKLYELMSTLKALRVLTPELRDAVSRHLDSCDSRFRREYLSVPILFEFTVGEHPRLPRYARHFRSFSSKISGRHCGDAQPVIAEVFEIMRQTFGKKAIVQTGDMYIESMYEMAEMRGE